MRTVAYFLTFLTLSAQAVNISSQAQIDCAPSPPRDDQMEGSVVKEPVMKNMLAQVATEISIEADCAPSPPREDQMDGSVVKEPVQNGML